MVSLPQLPDGVSFQWNEATRRGGESNEMKCLRRIMTPRADGTLLVPKDIADRFKDTHSGGREAVLKLWEQSGCNKELLFFHLVSVLFFLLLVAVYYICSCVFLASLSHFIRPLPREPLYEYTVLGTRSIS